MRTAPVATAILAAAIAVAGCTTVDEDSLKTRNALLAGNMAEATRLSENLANESHYTRNLGMVEAGRVQMLAGNSLKAEEWFRKGVDSAIDRKEAQPKIKLGDVGNSVMSATVTDDRTRNYYLHPYEINLALMYLILNESLNGRKEDALADARLAVYVQDNLASTYGEDLKKGAEGKDAKANQASAKVYSSQSAALQAMMAASRNSWENPALWWLTGVLFEADGDLQNAWQSYRKAAACRSDNPVFALDVARADRNERTPLNGKAKMVVLYEEGIVPLRTALKIPVPIYTAMSIDIPTYAVKSAYCPAKVAISGITNLVEASPAMDVRALAARDLDEQLPGVICRNITRAAVQAGLQYAVNAHGNEYAQLAVIVGNAVVSALRRADTRSWISLPDGQLVWEEGAMEPGEYQIGVNVNGKTVAVPVKMSASETKLIWIANFGSNFKTGVITL